MRTACISKTKRGFVCATVFAVILAFIAPVSADVVTLYAQGFVNNLTNNTTMGAYGWETYYNTNATSGAGSPRIASPNAAPPIAGSVGSTAITNVNASAPYGENIQSGAFIVTGTSIQFAFTELTIDRKNYEDIILSFDIRSGATVQHRFAVKIGDDWYASDDFFFAASTTAYGTRTLQLDTANLIAMDAILTGTAAQRKLGLSTAPAVSFSSITGNITAIGFFLDPDSSSNTTMRLDNFIVTASPVPEPATLGLLMISIAGIFGFRRIREERA